MKCTIFKPDCTHGDELHYDGDLVKIPAIGCYNQKCLNLLLVCVRVAGESDVDW